MVRAADGTLYFAESGSYTVRKVDTSGTVTTIAGLAGTQGFADGVGSAARFGQPYGLVIDGLGRLYVTDTTNRAVRRIDPDGTVTTIAGGPYTGEPTYQEGTGAAARFYFPRGLALTDDGDLLVAESIPSGRVRRVTPSGTTSLVVSNASRPTSIANVGGGEFWIGSSSNCSLRRLSLDGTMATHPAESAACVGVGVSRTFQAIAAIGANAAVLVTDGQVSGVATVTGAAATVRYSAEIQPGPVYGVGSDARLGPVTAIAGRSGSFVLALGFNLPTLTSDGRYAASSELNTHTVRGGVTTESGTSVTLGCAVRRPDRTLIGALGSPVPLASDPGCGHVDGTASAARFRDPEGLAADSAGNIFVADTGNHVIRRIATDGTVTTVAGGAGQVGSADGVGTAARFNTPTGVAVDASGVLYVADSKNHTIRRIAVDGTVTTLAGLAGDSGTTDGTGTAARFNRPTGVALRGTLLLVADRFNHAVRAVTTAGGVVTTYVGLAGTAGSADGAGNTARFREPRGLVVDVDNTVYVVDAGNYTVRVLFEGAVAAPVITAQPVSTRTGLGSTATFAVTATGNPTPAYQWQESNDGTTWVNLFDGGNYSGTRSASLTVQVTQMVYQGRRFRCVVTNALGTEASTEAVLGVNGVTFSPTSLTMGAAKASASDDLSDVTPPQRVSVSFTSNVTPVWTVTTSTPWIQLTDTSGTGAGAFTVGIVNPGNVIAGQTQLNGTVTLTSSNAQISTTFAVRLVVPGGNTQAPIGNLDMPADGATGLQGAIVVSGWALDDVQVDRVEIWRDLVSGDSTPPYVGPGPGNGKVFIAQGLFGEGTRPDVFNYYRGTQPMANRAGWGYMLLTYGFPNGGNGTYVLRAFAYDKQGNYTSLGAKTISVNNNAANKPFGTIDYPEQNGTVSGTYTANGWVLTPNVGGVPTCTFSHIVMELDSNQTYIPVTYGTSRPDVTSAFPGLSTSSAPGAQVTFDTRAYANGLHTIGWLAYDTCGRGEGIGSRFIWVNNPTTDAPMAARAVAEPTALARAVERYALQEVAVAPMAHVTFELPVIAGASWRGMQLVNGETQPLPVGSTLDPVTSTFQWRPLAGFFGTFELRFVAERGGVAVAEYPVRVVVR